METLDARVKLSYDNGTVFPPNVKMLAFVFMLLSILYFG
jgi:hypothetical protein